MTDQTTTPLQDLCTSGVVLHTHTDDGSAILCLASCDCGRETGLPALFNDTPDIVLTLFAPDADDERGAPHEHPRINVHVNLGTELDHRACFTFDACAECMAPAWDKIFTDGGGRIGVHYDEANENNVLVNTFRIGDWPTTRKAVDVTRARWTPNFLDD